MKAVYKNFTLIDGTGKEPVENSYMVVEGEKIVEVGVGEYGGEFDEAIDLAGKYVMPGLINAHVHVTMEPKGDQSGPLASDAVIAMRSARNAKMHLDMGTTFLRDVGGTNNIDLDLRDAINSKLVEGAQFLASAKVVTMTGGHGWSLGREADGADEVRKAVREQLRAGADLIKLMATGGVMTKGVEPGSPQLGEEELRAGIQEAHKVGAKTATHAQGNTGIKNALRAGIDSVEHAFYLDEEAIDLMLKNGTWLVPTLAAVHLIVVNGKTGAMPEYVVKKAEGAVTDHLDSITRAYKAGVKIACGTDSGTPFNYHGSLPIEMVLLKKIGMDNLEILTCATKSSAECVGIEDRYGTIEAGKFADFLVLKENPVENLETVFDIEDVYKLGSKVIRKHSHPDNYKEYLA